jgi:hypothetical protein
MRGVVVKGLARFGNCVRHGPERTKCVDANLFGVKSGYSPMTLRL